MTVEEKIISINTRFQSLHYFLDAGTYVIVAPTVISDLKELIHETSEFTNHAQHEMDEISKAISRIEDEMKTSENLDYKTHWAQKEKWLVGAKTNFLKICLDFRRVCGYYPHNILNKIL